jgi:hypothetical protein
MPLKCKRVTVNIPGELIPLLEIRKGEEHIPSDSKYFLSLLLFDLLSRCPHAITAKLVAEPETVFYRMMDEIVENFPNARTKLSKWVEKRLAKIQEEEAENARSTEGQNI